MGPSSSFMSSSSYVSFSFLTSSLFLRLSKFWRLSWFFGSFLFFRLSSKIVNFCHTESYCTKKGAEFQPKSPESPHPLQHLIACKMQNGNHPWDDGWSSFGNPPWQCGWPNFGCWWPFLGWWDGWPYWVLGMMTDYPWQLSPGLNFVGISQMPNLNGLWAYVTVTNSMVHENHVSRTCFA